MEAHLRIQVEFRIIMRCLKSINLHKMRLLLRRRRLYVIVKIINLHAWDARVDQHALLFFLEEFGGLN